MLTNPPLSNYFFPTPKPLLKNNSPQISPRRPWFEIFLTSSILVASGCQHEWSHYTRRNADVCNYRRTFDGYCCRASLCRQPAASARPTRVSTLDLRRRFARPFFYPRFCCVYPCWLASRRLGIGSCECTRVLGEWGGGLFYVGRLCKGGTEMNWVEVFTAIILCYSFFIY